MSFFHSNLPPGVTGNEPHLTGIWPCRECGKPLPEEPDCPLCGKPLDHADTTMEWWCSEEGCLAYMDDDICPGGCNVPEWEAD